MNREMTKPKYERMALADKIIWARTRISILSEKDNNFYFEPPHKKYKFGVFIPASLVKLGLAPAKREDAKNKISYYVALKDAKAAAEVFAEEFKANGVENVWVAR